jgi:hypothetical protein
MWTKGLCICLFFVYLFIYGQVPVAARSEEWVCGRSTTGIAGSNNVLGGIRILFVVRYRSLPRADHSSRGVLLKVLLRCV